MLVAINNIPTLIIIIDVPLTQLPGRSFRPGSAKVPLPKSSKTTFASSLTTQSKLTSYQALYPYLLSYSGSKVVL